MENERKITEIFGKCYRLMHRIGVAMGDQFFADLWSRESDGLLSDFIVFLKAKSEMISRGVIDKITGELSVNKVGPYARSDLANLAEFKNVDFIPSESVRHDLGVELLGHVAQCGGKLDNRVRKILELLAIALHVGQTGAATPLLLERELLKLRLAVLDFGVLPIAGKMKKGDTRQTFAKQNLGGPNAPQNIEARAVPKLSAVHREILDFIRSRGEQVQNLEVFARFGNITRRTLKRKLSDLVSIGSVARSAKGKRVYYALSSTT